MKRKNILVGILLTAGLLISGCSRAVPEKAVTYSNLKEESIRYDLDSLLQTAGVPDARRAQLFEHADQINGVMKPSQLTEGFTPLGEIRYDPYELQDAWMASYPDFLGYNCRITSFSLYEDLFESLPQPEIPPSTELLEFDLEALNEDPSAFPDGERKFLNFFSPIPTEATKDVKIHGEKVKNAWHDRGIRFGDNEKIRMINVVFHMQEGERNLLYFGHSGILLPTPDGDLWFLEKLAFQKPYQVVRFQNRSQLVSYLMDLYDLDEGQPTAKPFVMENDVLLRP